MEITGHINMNVQGLGESIGHGYTSYTIRGEWTGEDSAQKGQIAISYETRLSKWMDFLRDIFPYLTISFIVSIVGCCFCGHTKIKDKEKFDSVVQAQNVEASACVHISRGAEK